MPTLIVISWRDIPSQVTAREGRRTAKAMLPLRFQTAVDKAATIAGKKDMDEYLAEWHRIERPCSEDLEAEVAAEVARLEKAFDRARLKALTANRGFAAAPQTPPTVSPAPDPSEAP
jgi:hypothetical protein